MIKITKQDPIAVANFVIAIAKKDQIDLTNLYLNKILFYVQGYYLTKYQQKLFNAEFTNWTDDPIISSIYDLFRNNSSSSIINTYRGINITNYQLIIINYNLQNLSTIQIIELNRLIRQLLTIRPWQMSKSIKKTKIENKDQYSKQDLIRNYQQLARDFKIEKR